MGDDDENRNSYGEQEDDDDQCEKGRSEHHLVNIEKMNKKKTAKRMKQDTMEVRIFFPKVIEAKCMEKEKTKVKSRGLRPEVNEMEERLAEEQNAITFHF